MRFVGELPQSLLVLLRVVLVACASSGLHAFKPVHSAGHAVDRRGDERNANLACQQPTVSDLDRQRAAVMFPHPFRCLATTETLLQILSTSSSQILIQRNPRYAPCRRTLDERVASVWTCVRWVPRCTFATLDGLCMLKELRQQQREDAGSRGQACFSSARSLRSGTRAKAG